MRAGREAEAGRGADRVASWAVEAAGRAGPRGIGPREGRGRNGPGFGWVLGFLGFGLPIFLSYFLFFSFLNLIQTKFEFKFEFEFKPHSNKIMHQHECNKNLNL